MGLYRPTITRRGRDGKRFSEQSPNWSGKFRHPETRQWVYVHTGLSNKAAAKIIVDEAMRRAALKWAGLVNPFDAHNRRPLSEHFDEFEAALKSQTLSAKHVGGTMSAVRRIAADLQWRCWADVKPLPLQAYLASRREGGLSIARSNGLLRAIKQFAIWMVKQERAGLNPIDSVKLSNAQTDRRRVRRALTVDEISYLLSHVKAGPCRLGVASADRELCYRLALETGLRAGELASLTWASFDLEADPPQVTIAAKHAKNRRTVEIPLRTPTAVALVQRRGPNAEFDRAARPFNVPHRSNFGWMFGEDVDAARAAWLAEARSSRERATREQSSFLQRRDADGRVLDFHALRHTFGTLLARAGVAPKVAMDLMRHSDINLTMKLYSHTVVKDRAAALDALPDLDAGSGLDATRAPVQARA